ncbi:NAD/NADP octopine/nopaline dehydrogenase family protein [Pseudotabrizicola alkalilacus]|uniref:2-dehydropantoate 2-reductase n=1 Tax=Pseudotabrizicola alkalilacus TaxID=2305252 RepID=A0A411YWI9_9RHOB|nr:NAD/NADP octopine/nopaline dehydrogenase family protein [Pseudotabrizicola alkalilacus]RGP35138.1 NAD/NADP octopine/nopaline dehydrogenase [Pseudotabrizicola alkalilacus]
MRVAIAGAGGIGYSYAAFLANRGHSSVIWSPSNRRGEALAQGKPLVAHGALEGQFDVFVATDPKALLSGASVVILALPAYGHKQVIDRLLPHLKSGQSVIISAHLSFSALYFSRGLATRGLDCPIIAWNTTASTGRQTGPSEVSISLLRREVEMAVIPQSGMTAALDLCTELFGARFRPVETLLAIDLGNLNPTVHCGLALFNLTRMEKGETWVQQDYMTPAVCRFLEDLDRERRGIAAALGVECRSVHQSYAVPGKVEIGPLAEMMAEVVKIRQSVNGPKTLDTRYVTEDVPFGLTTMVRLADMTGVEVPLHKAAILLFSSLYGRDFTAENDILPEISNAFCALPSLAQATANGWPKL